MRSAEAELLRQLIVAIAGKFVRAVGDVVRESGEFALEALVEIGRAADVPAELALDRRNLRERGFHSSRELVGDLLDQREVAVVDKQLLALPAQLRNLLADTACGVVERD
jgi:hypothetical protein